MAADLRVKEGLPEITEALIASYTECSRINHLGHQALPSREGVTDLLADLYEVIYPGFGRRQNLHIGNVEYYVGSIVDALHDKLTEQIARALRHDMCEESPHIDFEALAQAKTVEFLKRLPRVRDTLDLDVAAAFRGDPAAKSHHEIIFCYPGLEAITIYRVAHELLTLGVPYVPRMMTEYAHSKTGIDIHPGATIGDGFFIDHGTGVVIGETCLIGTNVRLYQGVTLGALSFQKDADDVTLEDVTEATATIALEGALQAAGAPVPDAPYANAEWGRWLVARLSYTGGLGYALFAPIEDKAELVRQLEAGGTSAGSAEDFNIGRLENGKPRYGQDISERYLAQEVNQPSALHFNKGCYLGQEIVERVRSRGQVHRVLMPISLETEAVPAPGTKLQVDGKDVAELTSAGFSSMLNKVVGLAYVRMEHAKPGTELHLGETRALVR